MQWQPVDDSSAELVVPFDKQQERMLVSFDPTSGHLTNIQAMKFKSTAGKKVQWNNGVWADEGKPWIRLDVEEVLLNVPVAQYIREDLQ